MYSHTSFFFLFFFLSFIWRSRFFRVFFVPLPLSLWMESSSYVLSFFRMVFFYLVTTGWIFYIISFLCENSIKFVRRGSLAIYTPHDR